MLHFVNQTKKDFVLRRTDDGILCLYEKENDSDLYVRVIAIGGSLYDALEEAVSKKLGEKNDEFEIAANRTSKFHVSVDDTTILYERDDEVKNPTRSMARMFGRENGLAAREYYFPKAVIFVITDTDTMVDLEYQDPELDAIARGDDYENAPIYKGIVADSLYNNTVKITAIFCNNSKWDKVPENTFIKVSDDRKLRFGTVDKKRADGSTYTINALIRCDADGNEIQSHRTDEAGRHPGTNNHHKNKNRGNGNPGGKKNKSHNKRGRGKMSELTKQLRSTQIDY